MGFKVAVTKEGFNVLTETTLNNFIYDSDYNTLKYHVDGTTNLIIDYSQFYGTASDLVGGTVYKHIRNGTIAHNLGYTPFFTGFARQVLGTAGTVWNMCPLMLADATSFNRVEIFSDGTNLYFQRHVQNTFNTGLATQTVLYKIFRNNTGL